MSVLFLSTASLSVVALSGTTMTYQWQRNGTNIPGATSASYSLLNIQNTDAGSYDVIVQNAGGSVTSVTVNVTVLAAPTITTQPQSQSVVKHASASLSVSAIGTGTLKYQWILNGYQVYGATNSTYSISKVQQYDEGNYIVVVTNTYGAVTSAVAALALVGQPAITAQPQSQTIVAGQSAVLTVAASGSTPLYYQWNFNNAPLPGATNSVLTLSNILPAASGNYTVVVSNSVSSATSSEATVVVTIPSVTLATSSGGTAGMTANGFGLQFAVPVGITYVVLASTDLQNWTPIYTNVASSATAAFNDAEALNHDRRFYKVMLH